MQHKHILIALALIAVTQAIFVNRRDNSDKKFGHKAAVNYKASKNYHKARVDKYKIPVYYIENSKSGKSGKKYNKKDNSCSESSTRVDTYKIPVHYIQASKSDKKHKSDKKSKSGKKIAFVGDNK